jgi:hypothetical protein
MQVKRVNQGWLWLVFETIKGDNCANEIIDLLSHIPRFSLGVFQKYRRLAEHR